MISHFFNEAFLLPWWLNHHRELFDHGVLIDWHSTDGSVDICRELVPQWEVIQSENTKFAAILCDFEVMKQESRFPQACKIALTTTEFLVAPALTEVEALLQRNEITAVRLPGAIMVDNEPHSLPDPNLPLTLQKDCGIWEDSFDFAAAAIPGFVAPTRSRIFHRYIVGAYAPGRHVSHLPGQMTADRSDAAIWWYGFSPWSDAFKARKLRIAATRDDFDKRYGFGIQHEIDSAGLEARWNDLRRASKKLVE